MKNEMHGMLSEMMSAAIAMHELFGNLLEAGFTEDQALTYLAKMTAEPGRNG